MDYVDILKRAWRVTWRHKVLWIFGLLAGGYGVGGGGGGGGSSRWSTGYRASSADDIERIGEQVAQWVQDYLPVLLALAAALVVLGLILWVLSVAATGGLIYLVDEAERGGEVRAVRGWSVGFRYWGRTFLIGLVLVLPVVVIIVMLIVAIVALAIGASGGSEATGAAIAGMCGLLVLLIPLLIVAGLVIMALQLLATRYAILEDRPAFDAIGAAWWALRKRFKDVAVMWLVMLAAGIAYGFALGLFAVVVFLPLALLALAGQLVVALAAAAVGMLIMVVPTAIYGTFYSAAWTVFFRRLTGREWPAAAQSGLGGAPQTPAGPSYAPPPPPIRTPAETPAPQPYQPPPSDTSVAPQVSPDSPYLPPPPPSGSIPPPQPPSPPSGSDSSGASSGSV